MRLWMCSLLFYTFIFLLCELGRYQFSKFDKSKHLSIIIILEFIGTLQICSPMFDVNLIIESYGMTGVFIEITFIEICNAYLLRDAFGDPCLLIKKFLKKKSLKWFIILLSTQFLAGLASFKLAKYWWSLKFHPTYNEMIEKENCESDLTVTLAYGMFVEGMGVISCKHIGSMLEKYITNETWNILLNAISSGIICVLGIQLTGMYANPIVAWACTFNCQGVSHFGHFLVYWIAPTIAHYIVGNFDDEECDDKVKNNEIDKKSLGEENKIIDKNIEKDILNNKELDNCKTEEEIILNSSKENIFNKEKSIESEKSITFTLDINKNEKFSPENVTSHEIVIENTKKSDESSIEEENCEEDNYEEEEEEDIYEDDDSSESSITQKYIRKIIILEFFTKYLIDTIQTVAPSFDVLFVLTHYGVRGFFIEITFLELLNSYFSIQSYADPCQLFIQLYKNKNKKWFFTLLFTQLFGGILSFQVARLWWFYINHPTYYEMLMNTTCHSHLNVSIINGMLIECLGVIGIYYILKFINKYIKNTIIINFLSAISIGSICVGGLNLTGMYINPIIAWSCTFNCQGLSHFGHFIVYWIGPILGNILIDENLRKDVKQKLIRRNKKVIKRVVCAISGGIDSSVSAYILQKKGFEVTGVYMNNWDLLEDDDSNCSRNKDEEDAMYVCDKLGIKLYKLDCVKIYWNKIFVDMLENYKNGRTVVPDVMCNKLIKFDELHRFSKEKLGINLVATGHYAQNSLGNFLEKVLENNCSEKARLLRAVDPVKDQTYFLASLKEEQLRRSMFPIGNLLKSDVRRIASDIGLTKILNKNESMGICFVGKKKNFNNFLSNYIESNVGNMIEIESNKIITQHNGIHNFTIGKRVRLPTHIYQCYEGLFVSKVDSSTNTVYVCRGSNHSSLYSKSFILHNNTFINNNINDFSNLKCLVQRNHPPVQCQLTQLNDQLLQINLKYYLKSLANGQFCVFYNNNECLGGGEIFSSTSLFEEINKLHEKKVNECC
uniref:tRNA-5-taurinomethyluridine 2-sulfurtransferase n=1 Tax=Strongyloides stercoralis TaxID=6248 RepID=A0AAF5I1R9_STRER